MAWVQRFFDGFKVQGSGVWCGAKNRKETLIKSQNQILQEFLYMTSS